MIGRNAVREAVRTAGVLSHVAAERAGALTAGIGRVVEPMRLSGQGDLEIDGPGLDDRDAVDRIELEDLVEAISTNF